MANHSPEPNNYQISKTWDEAMKGEAAKGEAELPQLTEAVKQTKEGGDAANNGGGTDEATRTTRKTTSK